MSKVFERWQPHLNKKIIAVTFEDNTTIAIDDNSELRGYLRCQDDRRENAFVRKHFLANNITGWRLMTTQLAHFIAVSRASKPRKSKKVTTAKIEQFITKWKKDHPATQGRGAVKAAAAHFKCSEDIISRRRTKKNSA